MWRVNYISCSGLYELIIYYYHNLLINSNDDLNNLYIEIMPRQSAFRIQKISPDLPPENTSLLMIRATRYELLKVDYILLPSVFRI